MHHPVNPGWRTRPGWSEFGAPRPRGAWKTHRGFDYYVPRGSTVYAAGDGVVSFVGFDKSGYGHYLIVRHAQYDVLIAHLLNRPSVNVGQQVTARTIVGTVGQSGNAGSIVWNGLIHPHVEVRTRSGGTINPLSVLTELDRNAQPEPPKEPTMPLKIIAPLGLPDRGIIGEGFGYAFSDPGTFGHICNVWGLNQNDITWVGAPSNTEAQKRAVFNTIINVMRAGGAPAGVVTTLKPVTDGIAATRADVAKVPAQTRTALQPDFAAIPGGSAQGSFTADDRATLDAIRAVFK